MGRRIRERRSRPARLAIAPVALRSARPPFAADVLDALAARIAVLDESGTIVRVNEAWRQFARASGVEDPACFVGASYPAVCEEAVRVSGDREAEAVLRGLRSVMDGSQPRFARDYACHGPAGESWFTVHLTRFVHDGATYLVAAHEDITARKRGEEELRRANEAIEAVNEELQEVLSREQAMARSDTLTGLHNRRHFLELSEHLVHVAQRYGTPLSVLMCDIDHFKRINDTYGHQAGDRILRAVADLLRENMRDADVLARFGGEEFIATLPNTTSDQALAAAEHIRESIAAHREPHAGGVLGATVSVGVAQLRAGDDTLERLVQRADHALYTAKNAGRNCSRAFAGSG